MKYDFCNFRASSSAEKPAELFFYGDIVSNSWGKWQEEDQYPLNVQQLLREIGDNDIDIHINSGGGSVFAGVAICNMLRNCSGHKTVYIDGIAASIASVIAMAGDEIIMPENAYMMIHRAVSGMIGNADEMRKEADVLEKLDDGIVASYRLRAQVDVTDKQLKKMMAEETWMTGKEASEIFDNIKIQKGMNTVACIGSGFFNRYLRVPEAVKSQNAPKSDMKKYQKCLDTFKKAYDL